MLWLLLGFLLSFTLLKIILGKEGTKPKIGNNLEIKVRNGKCFHLHHWIIFTSILLFLFIFKKNLELNEDLYYFLLGICLGFIIQGLIYKDRFIFLEKCN